MTEVRDGIATVIPLGYSVVLASIHWTLVAWGVRVEAASPEHAVRLGLSLVFLTWLAGIVGSRGHMIRRQAEEILRIDRTVKALSEANLDFQELASRVQREAEEQERKRIARQVHDIVWYTLTNIQMMMEAATDLVKSGKDGLEDLLVKSRNQAQRGLLETRRAMRNLREATVLQSSGMRRVTEVVRIFPNATKVTVHVHFGNAPPSFGGAIDELVYRMVQESLTNVLRHGNATEISVNFWVVDSAVRISISDNGKGSKEIVPGVGLAGMSERIADLGGTMPVGGNMNKTRDLLVDDQVLFVESLRTVLETRAMDFEVVGVALSGREAIQFVVEKQPDIILMDVHMSDMDGVEATKIIHEAYPDIHILMLTTFDDDVYVVEALNHGVAGYILKDIPPGQLIISLRAVCSGSIIISPQVANKFLRNREGDAQPDEGAETQAPPSAENSFLKFLSRREIEILRLIGEGADNTLIARKLSIAEQTVKNHVSVIYYKLHVHNRMQAMRLAHSLKGQLGIE